MLHVFVVVVIGVVGAGDAQHQEDRRALGTTSRFEHSGHPRGRRRQWRPVRHPSHARQHRIAVHLRSSWELLTLRSPRHEL